MFCHTSGIFPFDLDINLRPYFKTLLKLPEFFTLIIDMCNVSSKITLLYVSFSVVTLTLTYISEFEHSTIAFKRE